MSLPSISSISPIYGSKSGGYTLTISGSDFSSINYVSIGTNNVTPTSVTINTIILTVPSSTIQGDVNVIVNNNIGDSNSVTFTYGGNYYINSLYSTSPSNGNVFNVQTDYFKNIYFIVKVSSTVNNLFVQTNGSTFQLTYTPPGTGTVSFLDMIIISDSNNTYMYMLYSVTISSVISKYIYKYHITYSVSSPYISVDSPSTLLINSSAKLFISNMTDNNLIYLIGAANLASISSIVNFTTITAYTNNRIFVSATYKSDGYIYATNANNMYEILVSSLSTVSNPTQTVISISSLTVTPNIILWINNSNDTNNNGFYISDSSASGSNGGFNNGQIYQYVYSFTGPNNTGTISNTTPTASNLIVRGNSGSGNIYVTTGITEITNETYSNVIFASNGQWLFRTNSMTYNINGSGYTNFYTGAGSQSFLGSLFKYYNPTSGTSTGGDPHIKTIDGKIYNLPSDNKYFQLLNYVKDDTRIFINCSTLLFSRENYQLESMEFVKSQNGNNLEYFTETIDGMYENYNKFKTIFELTYLDRIYINYNDNELIIDMNSLEVNSENENFLVETENYDRGIYSVIHDTYHKKTEYTKYKKITIRNGSIILLLESDISVVDMNNFSIKFNGIDSDLLKGCLVSESDIIKINYLEELNNF